MSDSTHQAPAYLPAVDGLRAISILAVLAFHGVDSLRSMPGRQGWLGVDIFFVISGFLISRLAMAEMARTGRFDVRRFFVSRLFRISPAIWVLLSVYVLTNPLDSASLFPAVTLAALNLSDYDVAFGWNNSIESGLAFCWSLAVEEKYYLLFPFLMLLYRRFRTPLYLLMLVGLAEFWKFTQIAPTTDALRLLGAFDIRFDEILIGCLAASLLDRKKSYLGFFNVLSKPYTPAVLFVCILYFLRHFVHPATLVTLGQKQLCWLFSLPLFASLVGLLLLSLTAVQEKGKPCLLSKALSCPPMIALGRLSYSLYLWHGMAFLLVANLVLTEPWQRDIAKIEKAVLLAYLSYSLVEKPYLTLKKRLTAFFESRARAQVENSIVSGESSIERAHELAAVR